MDSENYACRSPQSYGSSIPGNFRTSLADMASGPNGSPGASHDQQRRRISQPSEQNGNCTGGADASAMNPSLIAGNPSGSFASLPPESCHQRRHIEERYVSHAPYNYPDAGGSNASTLNHSYIPDNSPSEYTSWTPGQDRRQHVQTEKKYVSMVPLTRNVVSAGAADPPTNPDSQRHSNTLRQFQSQCTRSIGQLEGLLTQIRQPPSAPPTPAPRSLRAMSRKSGSETVHKYGEVTLIHHTGVRASADNSAIDALFMCLSYNRLADVITSEMLQRLNDISSGRNVEAMRILQTLIEAFNTIEFDRQTGTPLPRSDLHCIRRVYPLDNPDNLNPTTIIKYLLNDIYGQTGCPTHTHLFDQTDLCRPVAFLDITSDRILISSSEEESENLNKKIIPLTAPHSFQCDKKTNSEARSPSNPAVVICENAYFKGNQLVMRAQFQKEWNIIPGTVPPEYATYCANSWLEEQLNCRFLHYECDLVCQPEKNREFLRSLTVTQTDDMAVTTVTEKKMSGYTSQTPNKGLITTRNYRRATNVNEMISEAWLERIKAQRGNRMAQQILPEQDNCPQVLIAALPEYRAEQQINIDWQRDVHLPTSSGDSKTPYILSALISREKSHCLAWFFDRERRLLHCTDSRGTTDPEGNAIPVQVTSPYPDSNCTLSSAALDCRSPEQQAIFDTTSRRIASLGKEACLLIYQKSPDA